MEINKSVLTVYGSMNNIVQVFDCPKDETKVQVDIYHPRKNFVSNILMDKEEAKKGIVETIERMKIAIQLFQEYLDGKRDYVYYWEFEDET
jgi:hypothetical protein